MVDIFQVGEIVIMRNADYWIEYDGVPAVVTGPCILRNGLDLRSMTYQVDHLYEVTILATPPRSEILARSDQMRKLPNEPRVRATKLRKPKKSILQVGSE